jgi:hypothetical protein
MQKCLYAILIDAPRAKVWHTMLDDRPYRAWTKVFCEGSYYQGNWSRGSKILFLGPGPNTGEEGGLVSRIAENIPYEFISIEHLGIVENGVEDTTSEAVMKWRHAFENYTFREKDGGTEVLVDIDLDEEWVPTFDALWPRALQKGGLKSQVQHFS